MPSLALASLTILLLGGLSELGLRLATPDGVTGPYDPDGPWKWLESDPVLGWRNRAYHLQAEFSINGAHLRGGDRGEPNRPRRRIMCLGDSRTFGVWLDLGRFRYDNDYPRYLDELFAARSDGSPVEVLNAGVIGYSVAHGLRWVRSGLIADLRPEVMVVAFGINDHSPSWDPALRVPDPDTAIGRALLLAPSSSRLWQLSVAGWRRIPALHVAPMSVPWVDREHYAVYLQRLVKAVRQQGVDLVFLDIGLRPLSMGANLPAFPGASTNDYPLFGAPSLEELHRLHRSYRDALLEIAAREQVPVADGAGALQEAWRGGTPPFGPYDLVHPNVEGARLLAATVYEALAGQRPAFPESDLGRFPLD